MQLITLQPIPNQETDFFADGQQYVITLRTIDDMTYMDVEINGATVITATPCIVGQQVIPYNYLEGNGGNFFFTTASGDNPQYANFGAGDILLYASVAELAAARGS